MAWSVERDNAPDVTLHLEREGEGPFPALRDTTKAGPAVKKRIEMKDDGAAFSPISREWHQGLCRCFCCHTLEEDSPHSRRHSPPQREMAFLPLPPWPSWLADCHDLEKNGGLESFFCFPPFSVAALKLLLDKTRRRTRVTKQLLVLFTLRSLRSWPPNVVPTEEEELLTTVYYCRKLLPRWPFKGWEAMNNSRRFGTTYFSLCRSVVVLMSM